MASSPPHRAPRSDGGDDGPSDPDCDEEADDRPELPSEDEMDDLVDRISFRYDVFSEEALKQLVDEKGYYNNRSEAIRKAIRALAALHDLDVSPSAARRGPDPDEENATEDEGAGSE